MKRVTVSRRGSSYLSFQLVNLYCLCTHIRAPSLSSPIHCDGRIKYFNLLWSFLFVSDDSYKQTVVRNVLILWLTTHEKDFGKSPQKSTLLLSRSKKPSAHFLELTFLSMLCSLVTLCEAGALAWRPDKFALARCCFFFLLPYSIVTVVRFGGS